MLTLNMSWSSLEFNETWPRQSTYYFFLLVCCISARSDRGLIQGGPKQVKVKKETLILNHQASQRATIMHLSASLWNGTTHSVNDWPKKYKLAGGCRVLTSCEVRIFVDFNSAGCREVENVSANQRLGRSSCFFVQSETHKLCRGRWNIASCQVSLNSVKSVVAEKSKMYEQIRGQVAILVFQSVQKYKLGDDIEILFPVMFYCTSAEGSSALLWSEPKAQVHYCDQSRRLKCTIVIRADGSSALLSVSVVVSFSHFRLLWNRWMKFNETW